MSKKSRRRNNKPINVHSQSNGINKENTSINELQKYELQKDEQQKDELQKDEQQKDKLQNDEIPKVISEPYTLKNMEIKKTFKGKTICLCMIVKNESRIILRCLESAKNVIDMISICDTGSTDNTTEIIEKFAIENNIPYKIHFEKFRDFGYNRTMSFRLARDSFPRADYMILLDADMILEVDEKFDKNKLTLDQYMIVQYNKAIRYHNTRLINAKRDWECIGVTHEFWRCKDKDIKTCKYDELVIDDREDGGAKSDKFERDVRLLRAGIDDPETPDDIRGRYYFYLAQTYKDSGNFKLGIKFYNKRIEVGGWEEEIYYSKYQLGNCYLGLNKLEKAVYYYLEAWQQRPTRAESLYNLARLYREKGKNHIALMYALQGKQIPYPNDTLFVNYHVYEYMFDYEIMITAYYVDGKKPLAKSSFNKLKGMLNRLPENIVSSVNYNSKFFE